MCIRDSFIAVQFCMFIVAVAVNSYSNRSRKLLCYEPLGSSAEEKNSLLENSGIPY